MDLGGGKRRHVRAAGTVHQTLLERKGKDRIILRAKRNVAVLLLKRGVITKAQ